MLLKKQRFILLICLAIFRVAMAMDRDDQTPWAIRQRELDYYRALQRQGSLPSNVSPEYLAGLACYYQALHYTAQTEKSNNLSEL